MWSGWCRQTFFSDASEGNICVKDCLLWPFSDFSYFLSWTPVEQSHIIYIIPPKLDRSQDNIYCVCNYCWSVYIKKQTLTFLSCNFLTYGTVYVPEELKDFSQGGNIDKKLPVGTVHKVQFLKLTRVKFHLVWLSFFHWEKRNKNSIWSLFFFFFTEWNRTLNIILSDTCANPWQKVACWFGLD